MSWFGTGKKDNDDILLFDFDHIEAETEKAWLIVFEDDSVWLPKSRCQVDRDNNVIHVPRWLAKEKELADE